MVGWSGDVSFAQEKLPFLVLLRDAAESPSDAWADFLFPLHDATI